MFGVVKHLAKRVMRIESSRPRRTVVATENGNPVPSNTARYEFNSDVLPRPGDAIGRLYCIRSFFSLPSIDQTIWTASKTLYSRAEQRKTWNCFFCGICCPFPTVGFSDKRHQTALVPPLS